MTSLRLYLVSMAIEMNVVARTRETRKPRSHDETPVLCGLECLIEGSGS
jgi:hypothetical protein